MDKNERVKNKTKSSKSSKSASGLRRQGTGRSVKSNGSSKFIGNQPLRTRTMTIGKSAATKSETGAGHFFDVRRSGFSTSVSTKTKRSPFAKKHAEAKKVGA